MSLSSCCLQHFDRGENVCPVCNAQEAEYRLELAKARQFHMAPDDISPATRQLLQNRAIPQAEIRHSSRAFPALLMKNPNRRRVFELFGFYLPERQARELLKKIHDFKWIEAEKVGRDIWSDCRVEDPFENAATTWAGRFLPDYLKDGSQELAA